TQTIYEYLRNGEEVYLDISDVENFSSRFPTITGLCQKHGVDIQEKLIPVAPGSHFLMGGIKTDLIGSSSIQGLYAVGEVACTGVHGANRLASNSLTEGVVAGTRVGRDLAWELPERVEPVDADPGPGAGLVDPSLRAQVRGAMSRHVGVVRRPDGLAAAADVL